MYKRWTKVEFSCDVYRTSDDSFLEHRDKTLKIKPIEYKDMNEAIAKDGDLETWAYKAAAYATVIAVAKWVGVEPTLDMIVGDEIPDIVGPTYSAKNISFKAVDYDEEPKVIEVPEFVLRTILDLEKRKVEAKTTERKDKIQKTIDELKQEYGIMSTTSA